MTRIWRILSYCPAEIFANSPNISIEELVSKQEKISKLMSALIAALSRFSGDYQLTSSYKSLFSFGTDETNADLDVAFVHQSCSDVYSKCSRNFMTLQTDPAVTVSAGFQTEGTASR